MEPTAIVLSLTRSFKEPLIKSFGDIKNEITYLLDDGLPLYIESFRAKFLNTKTFLFRDQKVNFHETYFPVTLKKGKVEFKLESLESLYQNGFCTTIIGNAGSGKSMQMKYLFLKALDQRIKIPIFIELKSLNDFEGELMQFIYSKILNNKLSPSTKILERILTSGNFIFLLDGYDELYSKNKQKITSGLEDFIDKYNKNWFVITSRSGSGIESFPRFSNNYIQPLKPNEINEFIDMQCEIIDDPEFGLNIKQTISKNESEPFKHYLSSPLLLSMFLFTYRNHPRLPKKKSKFYWNVYDTLSTRHDSFTKKGAWQHERKSGLQEDEIETILMWFSYLTLFEGILQFELNLLYEKLNRIKKSLNLSFDNNDLVYDLSVNLGILQKDGIYYAFPHKTLQEYFAAGLIKEQKEGKKKIYQDKLPILMEKTISGGLNNFWELCSELDEISFKEFFLINYIDKMSERLSCRDIFLKYENYYLISSHKYLLSSGSQILPLGILPAGSPESSFLDFIGISESYKTEEDKLISRIPIKLIGVLKSKKLSTFFATLKLATLEETLEETAEAKAKAEAEAEATIAKVIEQVVEQLVAETEITEADVTEANVTEANVTEADVKSIELIFKVLDPLENKKLLFPVLKKIGFDKIIEKLIEDIVLKKEEFKSNILNLKKSSLDLLDI